MALVKDTWGLSREEKLRMKVGAWVYDLTSFVRAFIVTILPEALQA